MSILIVGAGPSGVFTAYGLVENGVPPGDIVVMDRGRPPEYRQCPRMNCTRCPYKDSCHILCGLGGAGGRSDGKLTLSPGRGVQLSDDLHLGDHQDKLQNIAEICDLYAPHEDFEPVSPPKRIEDTAFSFESYPLHFYGTAGIRAVFKGMMEDLKAQGVSFWFARNVTNFTPAVGGVAVTYNVTDVPDRTAREIYDHVVLATGSYSADFSLAMAYNLGISLDLDGPAGFGIRLVAPNEVLEPLMGHFYDFKLYLEQQVFGTKVTYRSFCVNRGAVVVNERHPKIVSINGRSEIDPYPWANLAIMTKLPNAKSRVRALAHGLNMVGSGLPVYTPLWSFMEDDEVYTKGYIPMLFRDKVRYPLHTYLPESLLEGFRRYIDELSVFCPGLQEDEAYVIAPEIKYHMPRWPVRAGMEVTCQDFAGEYHRSRIRVVGNAAGYTDSISTAALTGLIAAESLAEAYR